MTRIAWAKLSLNKFKKWVLESAGPVFGRVLHKPLLVGFEMVRVCNLKCLHCDNWRQKQSPQALSVAEWKRLVEDLYRLSGPYRLCVPWQGGEPLLESRAVLEVVRTANHLGIATSIGTSATLIDDGMAREIRDSGLSDLGVSLDGIRPETHDLSRGVPGTFQKVMAGIGCLKKYGTHRLTRISTIVAGHNFHELVDLAEWARREKFFSIQYNPLQPKGADWDRLWPKDVDGVCGALDGLIALKKRGYPIANDVANLGAMKTYFRAPSRDHPEFLCGAHARLTILNDGTVHLCRFTAPIGNIRRDSIRDIWRSPGAIQLLQHVRTCKKPCILTGAHYRSGLRERVDQFLRR